ncbi:MAG: hypothetical protein D3908_07515 [Candidatus Electrothrix sp. AUS4]|nr:hypothetical protein [Candidatus Electrothrix sp. AUS4]
MLSLKKVLLFSSVMSCIAGVSSAFGAGLPAPEQCTSCHGVGTIYDEWDASVHGETGIGCFACHIPGKKQEELGLLAPGEKEGFHILGYFNGSSFTRMEGNEVCVRCHYDAHHAGSGSGAGKTKCIDCHMPEDGMTTYRVHNYDPDCDQAHEGECDSDLNLNLKDPQSIRKYVTRPHRVHTWKLSETDED